MTILFLIIFLLITVYATTATLIEIKIFAESKKVIAYKKPNNVYKFSTELKKEAETLVLEHLGKKWTVSYGGNKGHAKKIGNYVLGSCYHDEKTIYLNWDYVITYPIYSEWKDTIMHEIAHAKAGYIAGHGLYWKLMAMKLGANPSAGKNMNRLQEIK